MKLHTKQILLNLGMVFIIALGIFTSVHRYQEFTSGSIYNKARILVSDDVHRMNDGEDAGGKFIYYQTDLTGTVIKSSNPNVKEKTKIAITEIIQTDQNYYNKNKKKVRVTFPLETSGKVTGFVVFDLSKKDVISMSESQEIRYLFFPIILSLLLLLVAYILRSIVVRKELLYPIERLSILAEKIAQENFEQGFSTLSSNIRLDAEIDRLISAFELMREELLAKNQKERQLKKNQKELMSCISHDLRTPLSTIKAYSEGLRDGLAQDHKTQTEYIRTIINKTEVIEHMIAELLDYSNAEIQELSIEKKEQYIEAYFDRMIRELQVYVTSKGCRFHGENHVPDMLVSFDQQRMTQVIYNLIENAIKYMDKQEGEIHFIVNYKQGLNVVQVQVSDNGPGISMTDIPYVFDKFYRAEKSRNLNVPGAGLGLSICKYIIEKHGGEIWCKSKSGEGSTFAFTMII